MSQKLCSCVYNVHFKTYTYFLTLYKTPTYCRYADVDEYLCPRVLIGDGCDQIDWSVEIAAAHKVRTSIVTLVLSLNLSVIRGMLTEYINLVDPSICAS